MKKLSSLSLVLSAAAFSLCGSVLAQSSYPERAVRLIVPFSAGGGQDIFMRHAAPIISEHLGQTVFIENKPGAAGVIGANYVKASRPDGYTLLVGTAATHGMLQAMTKDLSFDAEKDFEPIGLIANVPLVLAVNNNVPANNVTELVNILRDKPQDHPYASSGTGAPLHLAGELFKKETKVESVHVPYKGSGPAMQDLVAGRISYMFDTFAATNPHVEAGTLKRLGIASENRFAGDPELPTLKEQGYDVVANSWTGIFAPAGTPKEVQLKILDALQKTMNDEALGKKLLVIGFEPNTQIDSERFRQFVSNELKKWQEVVTVAKIERN